MPRSALFAAAALAACLAFAPIARADALGADTPETTASGATWTAPKAWSFSVKGPAQVLTSPEGDARLVIVEVEAPDAAAAAVRAWALWRPDFKHPVRLVGERPAREGWDERKVVDYETSPNERAIYEAVAYRKGPRWTVVLLEGAEAAFEKRGAALNLAVQSLRPAGFAHETFAGRTAHRLDPERIEAIKAFVGKSMDELGVPGAGLALIDHGQVVYEGGLGVRELGKPEPVDAHTLFMIASNTKGMSTLLLAELVDQGKLKWDQPVTQVYPAFRLGSAETTSKVLMKHLVCACTGLPRKDFDWIFNTSKTTPATTTFTQLAGTEPTSGFGEVFQYNNLMASAAGYIGGHLVYPDQEIGAAYDHAMRAKVFAPLGMDDTTFEFARALKADHASAHAWDIDAHPAVVDMDFNYSVMPYRPAGGAWSSAHDMIRYVQDELTQGVAPDGKRLVSAENLLARRADNVPVGENAWYGMGLMGDRSWGVTVIHHGGSMAGFKSDWMIVPDAEVGAVILTNADEGRPLLRPFMRRLLEVLYDGKPEAEADVAAVAAQMKAESAKDRERLVVPPAPDAASGLAARYVNADLGHIDVRREGARVVFDVGLWRSHVASRKNDDGTTSFIAIDPGVSGFEFVVTTRDGKRALVIRDGQHEYVYVEA